MYDYYQDNQELINTKLRDLLDTAYKHNLMHNDLNDGNILYDFPLSDDPEHIEFKLIDWEWGEYFCKCKNTPLDSDNKNICDKCVVYNNHKKLYRLDYSFEHVRLEGDLRDGIKLY